MYLAHRSEDGREQSILEHAKNVSELCAEFAAPFGAEELAKQIGLAHDIGKYSEAFQRRIRGEDIRVDHSTAGAQEAGRRIGAHAAYCIAGHHAGLPDGGGSADPPGAPTLHGRLKKQAEPCGAFSAEITLDSAKFRFPEMLGRGGFTVAFWIRMLFSCLVDADYLDTERFMQGSTPPRGSDLTAEQLRERLDTYVTRWDAPDSELNRVRQEILHACMEAGEKQAPGLFTLTVPTGGGKTVSSLAFALHHAAAHGKKKIVYVIPYTSIIEQTADKFREVIGEDAVLEHHSNVDFGDDENGAPDTKKERSKLASENWDMPVVVTTAVQFFESLFANKTSRCRKLHNLADSVIIFDEAQMLPLPYLIPCVRAIAELVVNYGASCILCTATQPALDGMFREISPSLSPVEIAPSVPSGIFRRVRYEHLGGLSDGELAERLSEHRQALCIVSTRKQAQVLFKLLSKDGSFHLSTLMTPEHRSAVLETVRRRINDGLPCRVVATSLIEAGVDVDFPVVYRAEAGLDSIIQAAGRCNREGKRSADESFVYVFRPDDSYTAHLPHSMKRPTETMREVTRDAAIIDSPETVRRYFETLRRYVGEGMNTGSVVSRFEAGFKAWEYPFASVAEKFHIIDDNTRSVFIPHTEKAKELAELLRRGERSRSLLRKTGKYSVGVYDNQFRELGERGALEPVEENLFILTDPSLYDAETGLSVPDGGAGVFA